MSPYLCFFIILLVTLTEQTNVEKKQKSSSKSITSFRLEKRKIPNPPHNGKLSIGTPRWNRQTMAFGESSERQKQGSGWIGGSRITCDVCKLFIRTLQKLIADKKTTQDILKVGIEFCKTYKIESDRVCDLVIPDYSEMVLKVVRDTVFNPDEICGIVLGHQCAVPFNPFEEWNVTFSSKPKPPVKPHMLPKPGSPTLHVLHLTDIHVDVEYRPGADAECGEPLCCRAYDINPAPNRSRQAGKWGDYRDCDTPSTTLEELFKHLANISDQFDYVIFTGDIAAHDVWNQTRSQQLDKLQRLTKLFRAYLPNKPVYTNPGNHEGVPCNSFPPEGIAGESTEWLYAGYLEAWGYWLPPSTFPTIMKGGYYSFSPYPGLRIISLNSNYGASGNWWLMLNSTDPQGQLQWLADVLQDAEDHGEKVHVLSHFPPGEMMNSFALNYYRLVNRYENTLVGQFNGHTHKDEFQIFYDLYNKSRPVGMTFIGGSVTPYSYTNPGYRIYTIDGNYEQSSWVSVRIEVLDYTHYYLDVPIANKGGALTWQKEYSAKETYQMPSVFPEDWNNLVYRMKSNDTLFQKFNSFYYKSAETSPCDKTCKYKMLCRLKTARPDDPDLCKDLQ